MSSKEPKNTFPATVASLLNASRLVINKGAQDGVKFGQRFTVYALSAQDIVDPETHESLGRLEIIKGVGKVVHIQEKMSIVEAIESGSGFAISLIATFNDPRVGDKARPI